MKGAKHPDRLLDGELVAQLRLLELNSEAAAQRLIVSAIPMLAEDLDVPRIGRGEPLEDLDRRRLACAVGSEQAKALAAGDLEIEASDGNDIAVALDEPAAAKRSSHRTSIVSEAVPRNARGRDGY